MASATSMTQDSKQNYNDITHNNIKNAGDGYALLLMPLPISE